MPACPKPGGRERKHSWPLSAIRLVPHGAVILSGVARPCLSGVFRGRATQSKDPSSIYELRNRTSKRGSSTACPGVSRKTKSAGHSAQNDALLAPRRTTPRPAPTTPKLHTSPWTIFFYTNRYLSEFDPLCKDFLCILVLRPAAPTRTPVPT